MTRYYVDISADLIKQIKGDDSAFPDGWRLVERWGPRDLMTERWIVEDDYAPAYLEDCLVEPVLCRVNGKAVIEERIACRVNLTFPEVLLNQLLKSHFIPFRCDGVAGPRLRIPSPKRLRTGSCGSPAPDLDARSFRGDERDCDFHGRRRQTHRRSSPLYAGSSYRKVIAGLLSQEALSRAALYP